ncbi:MAG: DUF4268 domain-containing protein [Chloroflexi bacterium]|nr:DUF4268 domain-containing protein [Chloroflexota bacterium]
MTSPTLGRLTHLDPRKVWESEPRDFTPWLAANLDHLQEALGIEMELVDQEVPVGEFAVDILAKQVGADHKVIIENQLEATDHGHLGQLLAYAAGLDAKVVIWVSPEFRDEHKQTLDWLNFHTPEELSFFGIELELLQIGESLPAPHFKVVVQPNEWQEHIQDAGGRGHTARELAYHQFFSGLLDSLRASRPDFTRNRRAGYDSWTTFSSGRTGFTIDVAFHSGNRFAVELYIDLGKGATDANKQAFDQLEADKTEIEHLLGTLVWRRLTETGKERRACLISIYREGSIDSSTGILQDIQGWAEDQLVKFKEVFGSRILSLNLEAASESEH